MAEKQVLAGLMDDKPKCDSEWRKGRTMTQYDPQEVAIAKEYGLAEVSFDPFCS